MPKNYRFSRMSGIFFISIGEHFSKYKWFYIILGSICVSGIIVGFITGFKNAEDLTLSSIPDATLVKFIEKNITVVSVFFSRIFAMLGLFVLVWITNCKPWLSFITLIILVYRSFLLGITCSMLIVLYKIGGIINVVLIFIPFHLIALFALLGWCVVCISANYGCRHSGFSVITHEFWRINKPCFVCFSVLFTLAYIMEAILIPYITSAIFIGVS